MNLRNPMVAILVVFGSLVFIDSLGFRYAFPIAVLVGLGALLTLTDPMARTRAFFSNLP